MLLSRYLALLYFYYWHEQSVSAIPISDLAKCPWEDTLTMMKSLSLPGHQTSTLPAQRTQSPNRPAIDNSSKLGKRYHMHEHQDIEVEIHYHCPTSGRGNERFKWSVVWDSEYPDIQYYAKTNIGGFPDEDKTWDDNTFPAPFTGSWWWHNHQEFHINRHMCKRSYTGHFEGQVDFHGVNIFFIDRPSDALKPKIVEHCRGRSGDSNGRAAHCSIWTISSHCEYLYAVVVPPASPPH